MGVWHGPKSGESRRAYEELRKRVLAAARYRCQIGTPGVCKGTATTLDHIRPLAEGGSLLDPANCRAACGPCNALDGAKLGARRMGLASRRHSRAW
jgi:5-methylcytosine-specific restriction endonuclease McrA